MNSALAFLFAYATVNQDKNATMLVAADNQALATVNLHPAALTASTHNITAVNQTTVPLSYTFTTTTDRYQKIFSGQCNRVGALIYDELERLDRSDHDQNEEIVTKIANVIDLVGEPAWGTALLEADLLRENTVMFEPLLLAIGTARHKETETGRLEFLRQCANHGDYRVKRAAVRALGRMKTVGAKKTLEEIGNQRGDIGSLAAALAR